ncbi:unnamed protein product [Bursaphelenchus xylophilus]|uniref:Fucosyltransferase n=1 Tax=Bursaphelenchus xylophilus TaxID=6326 RepID=A0A1I7RZ60_BURXY|nr:unnamed protein product [Bursaphelenchus xylophilus]CAG9106820.1 unnamed protein product [Bursaphelenchus xylophilus]
MGSDQLLLDGSTHSQKTALSIYMLRVYKLAKSLVIALVLVFLLWFLLINFGPKRKKTKENDDIIQRQLMEVPKDTFDGYINIYVANDIPVDEGVNTFKNCPVSNCLIHRNAAAYPKANAVILTSKSKLPGDKTSGQVWILSLMESPLNTQGLAELNGKVNFTASYRYDSDFPTPYDYIRQSKKPLAQSRLNLTAEKTKKVLWLVSNCFTPSRRDLIADALGQYIQVDIKGECGDGRVGVEEGFRLMREEYKFYLAFENSQCKDYVTEKMFNALRNNILPIVYGEDRKFYEQIAPPKSFIHVDDFDNVKKMAEYLIYLDKTPSAYNEYFEWKSNFYLSDSKFYCRLCSALQRPKHKIYKDLESWWNGQKDCKISSEPRI